MTQQGLRRLGRRAPPRAHRPVQTRLPEAPARPRRCGRRTSRSSRSSRAAPASSASCTRRGTRAGRSPATARPAGACPKATPSIILEDMDLDGVDVAGDAPEPVAVRALLRRPRAVDGARPRLQRLRHRAVLAVLRPARARPRPIPLTDIDDAVAEIERVAAGGFRAILLPADAAAAVLLARLRPGVGRGRRPTACTCSSTPRPAA